MQFHKIGQAEKSANSASGPLAIELTSFQSLPGISFGGGGKLFKVASLR